MVNNVVYNYTNGFHNLDDNPDNGTIVFADNPFENISAGDYSLNNTPNSRNLLPGQKQTLLMIGNEN